MRGLAAVFVFFYHLGQYFPLRLAPSGYLAVDFFFVLSGFVLTRAYEPRIRAGLSFTRFTEMRLIRVYPLFAMGVALGLIKALAAIGLRDDRAMTSPELISAIAANGLMLPSPLTTELFPLNQPGWSLFFEVIINLAFALWLFRARSVWLVAVAGIGIALFAPPTIGIGHLNVGWDWATFGAGAGRTMYSFCVGALLARHLDPARLGRLRSWPCALVSAAILLAMFHFVVAPGLRPAYDLVAALLVGPALVAFGSQLALSPAIERAAQVLGDLSFPIYAIHFPVLLIVRVVLQKMHLEIWAQIVGICAAVLIAACVAMKIDTLVRARVSNRLRARRSARA